MYKYILSGWVHITVGWVLAAASAMDGWLVWNRCIWRCLDGLLIKLDLIEVVATVADSAV